MYPGLYSAVAHGSEYEGKWSGNYIQVIKWERNKIKCLSNNIRQACALSGMKLLDDESEREVQGEHTKSSVAGYTISMLNMS